MLISGRINLLNMNSSEALCTYIAQSNIKGKFGDNVYNYTSEDDTDQLLYEMNNITLT